MNADHGDSGPGRLVIRADDPNLTPYAGLAIVGEMVRRTRLVELIDAELGVVGTARAVKRRRRGLSAGALVVSLAECQIAGAECFDDIEDVRADRAGAPLRAVADTPSAPAARQLARRFRRSHIRAIERAQARVGEQLDRELGRDPGEAVDFDLDATETEVYGRQKRGAARSQVSVRGDSGFYSAQLMLGLRKQQLRFTLSAPRTTGMWRALREIPEHAWADATEMRGAQVAETAFTPDGWAHEPLRLIVRRVAVSAAELRAGSPRARRRSTIPADQLAIVLDGQLDSTYAYSFIATDIPAEQKTTVEVEHYHRQRAQIEERFKDAKLGQPLRHLPSGDLNANRLWLASCLIALNITAMVCDISPAAGASGAAPERTPLRRHAKALRQILFCVPARITRSARQTIMHLPEGFRHLHAFQATYDAAYALGAP